MRRRNPHTELVNATLKACAWLQFAHLVKVHAGLLTLDGGRKMRAAAPGTADILGCVRVEVWERSQEFSRWVKMHVARFIALECKTGRGKPSKLQRAFLERVNELGGYAVVIRHPSEAVEHLRLAADGEAAPEVG